MDSIISTFCSSTWLTSNFLAHRQQQQQRLWKKQCSIWINTVFKQLFVKFQSSDWRKISNTIVLNSTPAVYFTSFGQNGPDHVITSQLGMNAQFRKCTDKVFNIEKVNHSYGFFAVLLLQGKTQHWLVHVLPWLLLLRRDLFPRLPDTYRLLNI